MNSLQKVFILFVATVFLVAMGAERHYNLESFVAEPIGETHSVAVKWTVTNPGLVSEFQLERKRGTNSTQQINGCTNLSSNTFQCVDSDLYKGHSSEIASTEIVTYVLHAKHNDGKRHKYGETVVEYTTNAVRRTWGSIKSMFQ